MPTFKAVVMRHQERQDGKFPVAIRVTHNRRSAYMQTGLYISKKQINSKTFDIKDQFVIERTNSTIRDYERALLSFGTDTLANMSVSEIKRVVASIDDRIDFYKWCEDYLAGSPTKSMRALKYATDIMKGEMGISSFYVTNFTSNFLEKYKSFLDKRYYLLPTWTSPKKMTDGTKRRYVSCLCSAFRMIKKEYNTEFIQVVKHDPFVNFENFPQSAPKKRPIDLQTLRMFFEYEYITELRNIARDVMKISFCLCGINLMDLFVMDKDCYDKKKNRITYNRSKTKKRRKDRALSSIRIEPEIQGLIDKYMAKQGERLFYFGDFPDGDVFSHTISNRIYWMCKELNIKRMSPYWFRHTWATVARNKCGVSKDDIDLCLNHIGNNPMADVYIDYDWSIIDIANRKVLDYVFHSDKE